MEFKNIKTFGITESIQRAKYAAQTGEPANLEDNPNEKRAKILAAKPANSGEGNFLTGCIVQFDMLYPQYFSQQLQRYHFLEIITSQSKMHSIRKIDDISKHCNKWTLKAFCMAVDQMILSYNNPDLIFPHTFGNITCNNKPELFQMIVSNLPSGFQLWMAVTTNYLQLKTIWQQRRKKPHKLEEWAEFGVFIEQLPKSYLITG